MLLLLVLVKILERFINSMKQSIKGNVLKIVQKNHSKSLMKLLKWINVYTVTIVVELVLIYNPMHARVVIKEKVCVKEGVLNSVLMMEKRMIKIIVYPSTLLTNVWGYNNYVQMVNTLINLRINANTVFSHVTNV